MDVNKLATALAQKPCTLEWGNIALLAFARPITNNLTAAIHDFPISVLQFGAFI